MPLKPPIVQAAIRSGHRVQGRIQLRGVTGNGIAPAKVIEAVKAAAVGRPSKAEADWLGRVELLRQLMLTSPTPLNIVDFGAGLDSKFDDGKPQAENFTVRPLSEMARSSKKPYWAYLLFRVVRTLQPETCIEMGACVGVSAAYQAAALALNGKGKLITMEGADVLAARSARTLEELDLDGIASVRLGRFTDTLPAVIDELSPIDYAFIDGHHVESATLDYMEAMLPRLSPEAVLVFDDIDWSDGMKRAWAKIAADERFALTLDLGTIGFAVVSASSTERQTLRAAYN